MRARKKRDRNPDAKARKASAKYAKENKKAIAKKRKKTAGTAEGKKAAKRQAKLRS